MTPRLAGFRLVLGLAGLALAHAAFAQPDARDTSAGTAARLPQQGTGAAAAGTSTGGNGAAVTYPTVDSAFANSDGIAVPDSADQSPGHQRLTDTLQQNTLFTADGDVRLTRLMGADVFASSGERLGTVRDVVLSGSGEPQVLIRADGRTVAVPWSQLAFALPGNGLHGKAVLPGETPHALRQLPEYRPPTRASRG